MRMRPSGMQGRCTQGLTPSVCGSSADNANNHDQKDVTKDGGEVCFTNAICQIITMGFGGIRKLAAISGMTTRLRRPNDSAEDRLRARQHQRYAQSNLRQMRSCFAGPWLTVDTRVNGKR
jgi:hypothetical protein